MLPSVVPPALTGRVVEVEVMDPDLGRKDLGKSLFNLNEGDCDRDGRLARLTEPGKCRKEDIDGSPFSVLGESFDVDVVSCRDRAGVRASLFELCRPVELTDSSSMSTLSCLCQSPSRK